MALKPVKQPSWPAPSEAMEEARQFLRDRAHAPELLLVPRCDVDSLAAAVLLARTVRALEGPTPRVLVPRPGEAPTSASMRARARHAHPSTLIVTGPGPRPGPLVREVPTLLLGHEAPERVAPGALLVSSHGSPPVAPTSLLAYFLTAPLLEAPELEWLALLGTLAEAGPDAPFPGYKDALKRHGRTALVDTIGLLQAARRAPGFEGARAFQLLLEARTPADIARGRLEGVSYLRGCRDAVQAWLTRCGRVHPRTVGEVSLVTIASPAHVEPLLAAHWAPRLPEQVVVVANTGRERGTVHLCARTRSERDLRGYFQRYGLSQPLTGFARAVGGELSTEDFRRLVETLGLGEAAQGVSDGATA